MHEYRKVSYFFKNSCIIFFKSTVSVYINKIWEKSKMYGFSFLLFLLNLSTFKSLVQIYSSIFRETGNAHFARWSNEC